MLTFWADIWLMGFDRIQTSLSDKGALKWMNNHWVSLSALAIPSDFHVVRRIWTATDKIFVYIRNVDPEGGDLRTRLVTQSSILELHLTIPTLVNLSLLQLSVVLSRFKGRHSNALSHWLFNPFCGRHLRLLHTSLRRLLIEVVHSDLMALWYPFICFHRKCNGAEFERFLVVLLILLSIDWYGSALGLNHIDALLWFVQFTLSILQVLQWEASRHSVLFFRIIKASSLLIRTFLSATFLIR